MYRFEPNGRLGGMDTVGGHYCGPTRLGLYKMPASWIDTDNKVWSEPVHLYTETAPKAVIAFEVPA